MLILASDKLWSNNLNPQKKKKITVVKHCVIYTGLETDFDLKYP